MKVTRHPKGAGVRWHPRRWRGPSLVGGRVAVTVLPLLPLLSSALAGQVISPCCQVGTEVLPRTHFSRGSARDPLSFHTPHLRFSSRSPQQPIASATAGCSMSMRPRTTVSVESNPPPSQFWGNQTHLLAGAPSANSLGFSKGLHPQTKPRWVLNYLPCTLQVPF